MKPINYEKLEREFVTDPKVTLNGLAKKYGIPSTTPLYRYAKKHEWSELRKRRGEYQHKLEIERQDRASQTDADAWEKTKALMREVIEREWEKIKAEHKPSGSQVSALAKATRDAREMGAYGQTLTEQKMIKDIERLEKELAEASKDPADNGIEIRIQGGDGLDG